MRSLYIFVSIIVAVSGLRLSINSGINTYRTMILKGRVSSKQEDVQKEDLDDEMVPLPFNGIMNTGKGGLFDTPVNTYDPTKDTSDLPGEDGSDEKIAAIQKRIKERVEELQRTGEWEKDLMTFGKDPLAKISLLDSMIYQIQSCRPFDSVEELGLTYGLVLFTSAFLMVYLYVLKEGLDSSITWYLATDFDFLGSIIRNN